MGQSSIDLPFHQRDPHDCRKCAHSLYLSQDTDQRYLRCGRFHSVLCVFVRDEKGDCKPQALNFKAREA